MNIFVRLIGVHDFFPFNFPLREYFFCTSPAPPPPPITFLMVRPLWRLFYLVQFIKCCQFSLELNSRRLYRNSEKEKESQVLS